ncbi:MAG: hypothetical protein KBA31_20590 [Alphaproteobacteria bacterium]|nr:hypothetical protein [Alphaproteobacteria bacterium]
MEIFRLHKYDPTLYDAAGQFCGDDWTTVSDIGRAFAGKVLTAEEYLGVEQSYVLALAAIAAESDVSKLCTRLDTQLPERAAVEKWLFGIDWTTVESFKDREWIQGGRMAIFFRLCLRGIVGHAATDESGFFIAFTGDYYVHLGTNKVSDNLRFRVASLGLNLQRTGQLGDSMLDGDYYQSLLPHLCP